MLIDWFTVVAQIINFLVLVALLKHFLWGRLVASHRQTRKARRRRNWPTRRRKIRKPRRPNGPGARHEARSLRSSAPGCSPKPGIEANEQRDAMIQQAREEVRKLEMALAIRTWSATSRLFSKKCASAPPPKCWPSSAARWPIWPAPTSSTARRRCSSKNSKRWMPRRCAIWRRENWWSSRREKWTRSPAGKCARCWKNGSARRSR